MNQDVILEYLMQMSDESLITVLLDHYRDVIPELHQYVDLENRKCRVKRVTNDNGNFIFILIDSSIRRGAVVVKVFNNKRTGNYYIRFNNPLMGWDSVTPLHEVASRLRRYKLSGFMDQ
jgi:hypothetical protein